MKKQTTKKEGVENNEPSKTKRNFEISREAQEDRMLLSGLLIERTENLVKEAAERNKKIREEIIEFHSGIKISLNQIHKLITATIQRCDPLFPNHVQFFSEMYRLLGWHDRNPNEYYKDPIIGYFINELIYRRFPKDVIPALRALAVPGGVRMYKFYHFLNPDAQKEVIRFRDEAIQMMKKHGNWKDFRKQYASIVPFYSQEELF